MQTPNLEELISSQEAEQSQQEKYEGGFKLHWSYVMDHIENYMARTEYITLGALETICHNKGLLCDSNYPMYENICKIYLELWASFQLIETDKKGIYTSAMQAMQALVCLDKLFQRETGKHRYDYA